MGILINRNFAILFSGQLVSTLGNNLYLLALPWFVYTVTASKLYLALVGGVSFIPGLAGIVAGVFVDRWNKKWTMLWSDGIRMCLALFLSLMALYHWPVWLIVTVAVISELAGAFFQPAAAALTPMLVNYERLPSAMGMNQSGNALAQLAGMVLGGALMGLLGAPLVFLLNGLSFLVSVLSLLFVRSQEPAMSSERRQNSVLHDWVTGLRTVARSQTVILIIVAGMITNFGLAPLDITLTAWVKGPLHGTAFVLGLLGAGLVTGSLVGGMIVGRLAKVIPPKRMIHYGLIAQGVTIALTGAWANLYWAIALMTMAGFILALVNSSLSVLLIGLVRPQMRGRVFGTFNTLIVLASPLGLAVIGLLLAAASLWLVWLVIGGVSMLGGLAYFLPVRADLERLSEVPQTADTSM